jgi:hypothetical protein
MKKSSFAAFGLLVIASMLVMPAFAVKKIEYRANGKLTAYEGVAAETAEIVNGNWQVKVMGGDIKFDAFYRELNLDSSVENSPDGTIDDFKITLINDGEATATLNGNTMTITGYFQIDKKMWLMPDARDPSSVNWYKPFVEPRYGSVTISPSTIYIDILFNMKIDGTTLSAQY